jgi:hypothetical protein
MAQDRSQIERSGMTDLMLMMVATVGVLFVLAGIEQFILSRKQKRG